MFSNKHNRNKGFSLNEVLISVAIIGVVSTAIGTFQSTLFLKDRSFRGTILATQEARLALRRFLEESRAASQSSVGSYAINSAQDNSITFYADSDGDGLKERYRYFISGTNLNKGVLTPTGSPIGYTGSEKIIYAIHNLSTTTAPIFTYYDTNDATITPPVTASLVRSVRMSVSIAPDLNKASSTISFSTRSTFRNLRDNY
jgi:prepilin-type N-terminal cleavage/methylation domain-containing protein